MALTTTPTEMGQWMLSAASSEWFRYDEDDTFTWEILPNGTRVITDGSEGKTLSITPAKFFTAHRRLIFNGEMDAYAARSWWAWACKDTEGASSDDYDDYTCDFVLQVLLYGEVIYS